MESVRVGLECSQETLTVKAGKISRGTVSPTWHVVLLGHAKKRMTPAWVVAHQGTHAHKHKK